MNLQLSVSFWQRVHPFMWQPIFTSSVFWRASHILACLLTGWLQRLTVTGCHLACDGCKKKPCSRLQTSTILWHLPSFQLASNHCSLTPLNSGPEIWWHKVWRTEILVLCVRAVSPNLSTAFPRNSSYLRRQNLQAKEWKCDSTTFTIQKVKEKRLIQICTIFLIRPQKLQRPLTYGWFRLRWRSASIKWWISTRGMVIWGNNWYGKQDKILYIDNASSWGVSLPKKLGWLYSSPTSVTRSRFGWQLRWVHFFGPPRFGPLMIFFWFFC